MYAFSVLHYLKFLYRHQLKYITCFSLNTGEDNEPEQNTAFGSSINLLCTVKSC